MLNSLEIQFPVSGDVAKRILSNDIDRSIFLDEYLFLKSDGNHRIYKQFIIQALWGDLVSRRSVLVDALDLCIKIDMFSKDILEKTKEMLMDRNHYFVKLSCLDYLAHFMKRSSRQDFLKVNSMVYTKSTNHLVRVQSLINLISIGNLFYFESLLSELTKFEAPAPFYRVINGLEYSKVKLNQRDITRLTKVLLDAGFREQVNKELLGGIRKLH